MYFIIWLLCTLFISFLLRYLSFLLGRNPIAEFPADSTDTPTPPSSLATLITSEHENVPAPDPTETHRDVPSSSGSSSNLTYRSTLPVADSPNTQIRPSSSSSSFVSEPNQKVPTNSTNTQPVPSSSIYSSPFNLKDGAVLVNCTNPETVPSSSGPPSNWEHDVFISFRGKDTRNSFTSHLHGHMDQFEYGITPYIDAENLKKGRPISDLLTAIEESRFAVVVLSTNYAGSAWCLRELAHILECEKLRGMKVLPVFYHVAPAEIKYQIGDSADQTGDSVDETGDSAHPKGDFAKAFAKHENRVKKNKETKETVDKWRKALYECAGLSGWHVTSQSRERDVVLEIASLVSEAVRIPRPETYLVGMEARIKEVESRLNLGSNDVLTIGIWGMGGIGKSTLAAEVFKKISEQFERCGFVSGVRLQPNEVEVQRLLCQYLSGNGKIDFDRVGKEIKLLMRALFNKKVLIVLDDVDNFEQIKCLARKGLLGQDKWGGGSRLIIITTDKSTLGGFDVQENEIYEVEKLNHKEAFELLRHKAFEKDTPPNEIKTWSDEFEKWSDSFLKYADGNPLALEVLGSHLSREKVVEWPEILLTLDGEKDPDIFTVLQISYDGLGKKKAHQEIFLDIACFFNGEDYVRVKKIWEGCGFASNPCIRNLLNKSLIKIGSNNELWMHDLLRRLGWHIVHEEDFLIPRNRSRLWLDDNAHKYEGRASWRFQDARNVLETNNGPSAVRGLFLSLPEKEEMCMMAGDPLLNMRDLRLLKICNVNFQNADFQYLPPDLRLLEWHECPLRSLPSNFQPNKLVEFKMPNSRITKLWNEAFCLRMLVLMDLSNCQDLVTSPDFSKVPKLETLILEGCKKLSEVHSKIGDLQHLGLLNLKGCVSLDSLPASISLKSLQTFILSGCSKIEKFPEILGDMKTLSKLYLDGTAIRELPESIQHLKDLTLLNLSRCKKLLSLPNILCRSLTSLNSLHMSLCSSMDKLPEDIGYLKNLQELDACETAIRKVPESISRLKNLKLLCFHGCRGLQLPNSFSDLSSLTTLNLGGCCLADGAIPVDIGDLLSLKSLDLSENNFSSIPESISQLSELKEMSLFGCVKLLWLPKNPPENLEKVDLCACIRLITPVVWKRLGSRDGLNIINCRKPQEEEVSPQLSEFASEEREELDLSNNQQLTQSPNLNKVPNLKRLILKGCKKLTEVHPTVWGLQHLVLLNLKGCEDLERLPRSIRLGSLEVLILSGCSKLKQFPEIDGDMNNLSELHLDGTALRDLPRSLQQLEGLVLLNLSGCKNLLTIPHLLSLKSLNLSGCSLFPKLPINLGSWTHLQELNASETALTTVPQSIIYLTNLKVLSFYGCIGLQLQHWFSELSSLTSLNLGSCDLAEEQLVRDIICRLSHLQQLDLSGNNFVSLPNEIGRLSSLQQLNLSGNNFVSLPNEIGGLSSLQQLDLSGNNFVSLPNEIGRLSSLQQLNLSGNNFVSLPNEIGCLSSLQQLDLSKNNFVEIPESISQLLNLTELGLSRCSKLQSLPENLPVNLKNVHARDCPMLKKYATLTIWGSDRGFCFIINGNSDQDDDHQPRHFPLPVPKEDRIEVLFPRCIKDRICRKEPFEIRFPHSIRIPNFWSCWSSGPSVDIPVSNSTWMGFALFVVFEILEKDDFDKSWELEETVCDFYPNDGHDNSLVFQNFINFRVGSSYGVCCYEPRSGQFGGLLDNVSTLLKASVSTKRPDLIVRGCGIHLISQEDAEEFVQNLTYQTITQHQDFNFDRHCEEILDETTTGDLMELGHDLQELAGSPSTVNEDSCSKSNAIIQPRGELSMIYKGENGREKYFHFCFPAPILSTPPWFLHHHAGDVTLCYITKNLLADQRWVGLELYVQFSRCTSTSTSGNNSFFFCVDLCSHDHESTVMHGSLKINSCVGTSDQLVVLHVPRVHFQQQLNQCQGISALFRTIDAEMEVQVCGSRLAFEHDLEDLTHSFTAGAGTLGQHVLTQPCSQAQPVEWPGADEAEMPNCCSWFHRCRSTAPVLPEEAPSSSIERLRNHRCYLQQQRGFGESDLTQMVHFRSVMLLHSRSLLENRDRNEENVAEEDKSLVLARHHVLIMAETQLYGSYSPQRWKRCLKLLLRQSKVATLSLGGHEISALEKFDLSSPYNIICYSDNEVPVWFRHEMSYQTSSKYRVTIKLPPRLHEDENWRGLAICVAFKIHDQRPATSPVKLLCHLRAKDNYCLNPIPMCSITEEKLKSLHLGRYIWVTYIPRILLTEFSVISDVEARIYVSCPSLTVEKCGMRLLYRQEEGEFENTITECWTSFFDNLSFIRQLVEADDQPHELPMLEGRNKVSLPLSRISIISIYYCRSCINVHLFLF
ncbi:hypothetical protein ABKV19_007467 [Rosa sericea]